MNTARPRLGSDVFQTDPRADLKGPAKRVLQIPTEREGSASRPERRSQTRERLPHDSGARIERNESIGEPPSQDALEASTERKVRFGANVPPALKAKADNAAYWVPGLTISKLVEVALERELQRLEKEYNDGKPFGDRGQFRFGRPKSR